MMEKALQIVEYMHMMVPELWAVKFQVQLLPLKKNNLLQNALIVVVMLSILKVNGLKVHGQLNRCLLFFDISPKMQQYFKLLINFYGKKLQTTYQ